MAHHPEDSSKSPRKPYWPYVAGFILATACSALAFMLFSARPGANDALDEEALLQDNDLIRLAKSAPSARPPVHRQLARNPGVDTIATSTARKRNKGSESTP